MFIVHISKLNEKTYTSLAVLNMFFWAAHAVALVAYFQATRVCYVRVIKTIALIALINWKTPRRTKTKSSDGDRHLPCRLGRGKRHQTGDQW